MKIEIEVNMQPLPQSRPRTFVRNGKMSTISNASVALTKYKQMITLKSMHANHEFKIDKDMPIKAKFEFGMEMPKSWSKKKKDEHCLKYHTSRPDLDNLIKAAQDALPKSILPEDKAIADYSGSKKIWVTDPFVKITLETIN